MQISICLLTNEQTNVLIMDFSKAFDKVSHSLLMHKLKHHGIHGKVNTCRIQNFLASRSQAVADEGEMSEYISVESGVSQGSVLGNSLFLFYINDMAVGINSTVRLLADITIAYPAATSEADQLKLQEDLNKPPIWEQKWKKMFHPERCNVLTISRKIKPIKHEYKLHGHILKSIEIDKYLGCHIASDLT